jgi:uncharacterized protein YecT (DUF1311 family)
MRAIALARLVFAAVSACLAVLPPEARSQSVTPTAAAQAGTLQEQGLVPRGSEKPSFACASAKTAAARLICADRDLARLDRDLSVAFQSRKAQIAAPDQSRFVAKQLAWLRDRNTRCELVDGKSKGAIEELAPSKPCMMNAITERIAFLAQMTASESSGQAQQPLSLLPPGIANPSESEAMPPIDTAALKKKLISLWNLPTSVASDRYHYIFKIRIRLDRDGRLIGTPAVLNNPSGPLFDAVRDSAVRAIVQAQPYDMLAPSRYEDWKEIEINFDTHDALAGLKPALLPPAAAQSSSSPATATASLSERFDAVEPHAQGVAQISNGVSIVNVGSHLLIGAEVYFLPTFIALMARRRNCGSIFIVNLLAGWTVIGWVIALVWACMKSSPTSLSLVSKSIKLLELVGAILRQPVPVSPSTEFRSVKLGRRPLRSFPVKAALPVQLTLSQRQIQPLPARAFRFRR